MFVDLNDRDHIDRHLNRISCVSIAIVGAAVVLNLSILGILGYIIYRVLTHFGIL